ncbi:hypothetical protein [uncultured Eudoraea sp.]|jgi:hypothetical protein|uniref:hypothetical protein n=1 Tax=uncultured Eudoraea sp. TaxID=1035614 RepID=UPI0026203C94|nr:hypothetical protein [uncultured Eudoraea sp.]
MAGLKLKWNSDKILSLSAMSVSVLTLIIFIYQTNLMSKQNYLSILPYVQISTSDDKAENTFSLDIKNHGVGPAIIESVIIYYKGEKHDLRDYDNYLYNYLKSEMPVLDSVKFFSSSTLDKGIAIPANSSYNVFSVQDSEKDYNLLTTSLGELLRNGLRYEITYRSIQNERWMIYNNSEGPEKLD